jgi:hypothetical protein
MIPDIIHICHIADVWIGVGDELIEHTIVVPGFMRRRRRTYIHMTSDPTPTPT